MEKYKFLFKIEEFAKLEDESDESYKNFMLDMVGKTMKDCRETFPEEWDALDALDAKRLGYYDSDVPVSTVEVMLDQILELKYDGKPLELNWFA